MYWHLTINNPRATRCRVIQASSLTQALTRASQWIQPDFTAFSLRTVESDTFSS